MLNKNVQIKGTNVTGRVIAKTPTSDEAWVVSLDHGFCGNSTDPKDPVNQTLVRIEDLVEVEYVS